MKMIDTSFFPGWTRKSVTFTIDDGNVKYDRKFLDIVKPFGILGTFNLCSHLMSSLSPEGYREFYKGYEIANHMKYHPTVFRDGEVVNISDDPFDPMTSVESTDEHTVVYRTDVEGIFKIRRGTKTPRPGGWGSKTDAAHYIKYVKEGKEELEEIFGKGSVKSFVWPCCEQSSNTLVMNYVLNCPDYYAVRKTGEVLDMTDFNMPENRRAWSYNATANTLLSTMEKYESYPDDGRLKFFSFGVHSGDFETFSKWDDLRIFAEKYGNRRDDYYYATVGDIFAYEDAIARIEITDTVLKNPTDLPLYIKIEGERILVPANSEIAI